MQLHNNCIQFKQRHKHCLFEMLCSVQIHSMCIQQYVHVRNVIRIVYWTDKTIVRGLHNIGRVSYISLLISTYYYMNINQHCVCAFRWWLYWCCPGPKPTFTNRLIRLVCDRLCIQTTGGHGCLWYITPVCADIFRGWCEVWYFCRCFIGALVVAATHFLHLGERDHVRRTQLYSHKHWSFFEIFEPNLPHFKQLLWFQFWHFNSLGFFSVFKILVYHISIWVSGLRLQF